MSVQIPVSQNGQTVLQTVQIPVQVSNSKYVHDYIEFRFKMNNFFYIGAKRLIYLLYIVATMSRLLQTNFNDHEKISL